jgi:hypothetical protein
MTTICWDGKSVAADTMACTGDYRTPAKILKVKQVGDIVFAMSGMSALFEPCIKWYLDGHDPESMPCWRGGGDNASRLLVFKDGRCFAFHTSLPYPDENFAPDAWGAGENFAIGAMKAGADARRAAEIAIECNPFTGGEVQVVDLTFQTALKVAA